MSDPVERRKPGRPKVDDPRVPVSTRIPVRDHDRLIRLAHKHDVSVSSLVRSFLMLKLR